LKVWCRRSLLVARRTVNFQELRLAIAHSRDRPALSDTFCFIICPAGDGEHCDATIGIKSTIGAANAAGPPFALCLLRRAVHHRSRQLALSDEDPENRSTSCCTLSRFCHANAAPPFDPTEGADYSTRRGLTVCNHHAPSLSRSKQSLRLPRVDFKTLIVGGSRK
jgi:hypothetical protein